MRERGLHNLLIKDKSHFLIDISIGRITFDIREEWRGGLTIEHEREMTVREYLYVTQNDRFEEELTRPRVEILPDEWADWVASHDEDNYYFACYAGGKASPFCPIGYH